VTAASGRLGYAILQKLAEKLGPEQVVGVARAPRRIEIPDIEKRRGDYQSIEEMTEAFRDVDTAIMISAPVTPGTDRVAMHRNVIEAAKRAGVRKLIYTSIIGNGDETGTHFFATQQVNRQAEQDLKDSGLDWIVGRNGLYLELDLAHIIRADADGVYGNNGGSGRCGYITIDELACAFTELATSDQCNGQVLNLVGENRTQAELIELANEVFGINVEYRPITVEQCVDKFMADDAIAARGEEVARMLAGCFQCVEKGAFDVPSDFERAAGRPAKSTREQMQDVRRQREQVA
jgi:NAD(P)H dehydrogenase (quinone)